MDNDLIRRKDALIKIQGRFSKMYIGDVLTEDINAIPSVDAVPKDFHDKTCEAMAKRHQEEIAELQPKRGKWIHDRVTFVDSEYKSRGLRVLEIPECSCSECKIYVFQESNFCPNCGADMRERKE